MAQDRSISSCCCWFSPWKQSWRYWLIFRSKAEATTNGDWTQNLEGIGEMGDQPVRSCFFLLSMCVFPFQVRMGFFFGTRVDPSVLVARRKPLPMKLLLLSAVWSQASATKTCVLLQTPVTHGWKHWLQWRQTLCVHPSPTRKMIQMSHWVHLPSCSVLSSLRALRHLLIFSPSMRPTYVPNSLMLWLYGKSWIRCCRNSAPRPK